MARHQLLLVNNGIHITESVFGYQTIIMTHSNQTFHNQEIMDIKWDGLQLQSLPPQYNVNLFLRDGKRVTVRINELQFEILSKVWKIKPSQNIYE